MAQKHDFGDEIGSISRQLESIVTDSNQSTAEHSKAGPSSSNVPVNVMSQPKPEENSSKGEIFMFGNILPPFNCPEKIIFIVDIAQEPEYTMYELGAGKKYAPLFMIKKTLEVFILAKGGLNNAHEFAIMTLGDDSVKIVCNFTKNFSQLSSTLEKIDEVQIDETSMCDLSQCFENIYSFITFEKVTPIPTSVTRVILIYTRSFCIPIFKDMKYFEKLMKHPYFFVDSIYVHEPLNDGSISENIYGHLQRLDAKNNSYILEVGRCAAQLYNTVVKLVAHPLQRRKQDDANYNIFLTETTND